MTGLILTWSCEPDPMEYPKVEPTLNVFICVNVMAQRVDITT